jgi:hypothetical protein
MRTSQLIVATVLAASFFSISEDVKHAPTLQSCVGDVNLWSSQISNFPEPNVDQLRNGLKPLTIHEIEGRTKSLGDCVNAYPVLGKERNGDLSAAMTLSSFYDSEMQMRYFDFIYRHGMLSKFTEEDDAGQR